ncbi:hypothetical protein HYU14_06000 [Candidatus Woesearchaeota archaeon]|nr:hypothetical protein [Candidatus Woesearchaeota archaeon]
MIDKSNFEMIKGSMEQFDAQRELLIKKSRDVLKLSKQVIYAVHRGDIKNADSLSVSLKKELKALLELCSEPKLSFEGSTSIAIQEYVEAAAYLSFVKSGKIIPFTPDLIDVNYYLMGLCDLTGELSRRATNQAAIGKFKETVKAKEAIDDIYAHMLQLDIRENDLRRKADGIKYELKKMEDLVCELKLRGKI